MALSWSPWRDDQRVQRAEVNNPPFRFGESGQPVHLLSPLVASTYLLVGLAEVEFGDHQRYTLLWALSAALVMLVATVALGVIPIVGHAR